MSQPTVNERLEGLKRRYATNLPLKVAKAAESVDAVLGASVDSAACETAHRQVHSLIGSSGTYGFHELSRVARLAEAILRDSLESGAPPSPERQTRLRELVAMLGTLAEAA